jgi:hypothetical protein
MAHHVITAAPLAVKPPVIGRPRIRIVRPRAKVTYRQVAYILTLLRETVIDTMPTGPPYREVA